MNNENKTDVLMQLISVLTAMLNAETQTTIQSSNRIEKEEEIEFLTVKECTTVIKGINEHTIRQLVAQEKVKFIRTGQGKRGKILINKASLLAYCSNSSN